MPAERAALDVGGGFAVVWLAIRAQSERASIEFVNVAEPRRPNLPNYEGTH